MCNFFLQNFKKAALFLLLVSVYSFQSFAADSGDQVLDMYNCYSKTLESTSPYKEILLEENQVPENSVHSGDIKNCLEEFRLSLENYMNSPLFEYEKVMDSSLYHIIKDIYDSCCISEENLDDTAVVLREYFSIQNQIIKMCHENQQNLNKSLILFLYVFIGLIVALIALTVFGAKYISLQNSRKQQHEILKTMIKVQEKERERISQDLHDTVVQDIRSVQFFTKRLDEIFISFKEKLSPEILKSDMENLIEKIQVIETRNLSEIRSIIKNLTPPELDKSDFSTILSDYCFSFSKNSRLINPESPVECKFYVQNEAESSLTKLSSVQKLNLFRIIQESLTNIQKYSKAEECSVFFTYAEGKLKMIISDDGIGMEKAGSNEQSGDGTHLGISGMRTRAQMIDADFKIRSSEIGTEIIVTLNI